MTGKTGRLFLVQYQHASVRSWFTTKSRFAHQVTTDGFLWLNIENRHILEAVSLPHFDDHKDPFDRLLVAQSLSEPLIFLTADAKLARYGSTIRLV